MMIEDIVINILVYMNIYGYYITPSFAIGLYYAMIRIFGNPLATRLPHELVIIINPTKAEIAKVTSRYLPFFQFKKGIYWFSDPVSDGHNKYHIYLDGINQSITHLKRMDTKVTDLLIHREIVKQTKGHNPLLPTKLTFGKNFAIVIDPEAPAGHNCDIIKVPETQPFKLRLLVRFGVYIKVREQKEGEESGNASANTRLVALTTQTILQQVSSVQENANFSSFNAFKIIKSIKTIERNWLQYISGAFDMRIILVLGIAALAVACIFLFGNKIGLPTGGDPTTVLGPKPVG